MSDLFRAFTSTSSSPSRTSAPPAPTLIGADTTIHGALDLRDGDLHVAGALCGPVCTTGAVHVTDDATVEGRVEADRVAIRGCVAADVRVTDTLILYPDASLRGRVLLVDGATLDIRMGARYNGITLQGDASARLPARAERRGDGLADAWPVVNWHALDATSGKTSPTEESAEETSEEMPAGVQEDAPGPPQSTAQDEPPPPSDTTGSSPNRGAPDTAPSPSRDQDDAHDDSATDAFGMEW